MTAYSPSFVAKTGESKNNTSLLLLMDQMWAIAAACRSSYKYNMRREPIVTPTEVVRGGLRTGRILRDLPEPKEAKTHYHEDYMSHT